MAAVISNRGGFYGVSAYASEARRMGLRVLAPSVNASGLRCRGRAPEAEDLAVLPACRGSLRFGLSMIAALREESAAAIVAERERGGPYASPEDLGRRVDLLGRDAEALVGAGALDGLEAGASRASLLWKLLAARDAGGARGRRDKAVAEPSLFAAEPQEAWGAGPLPGASPGKPGTASEPPPESPARRASANPGREYPQPGRRRAAPLDRRLLAQEMRWLGTTLAVHPLELWPAALARKRSRASDLPRLVGRRVELLGWPVAAKEVLASGGQAMEFVSFEDETALYETVLFPEAFSRYRNLLYESRPVLVAGKVECDRGALALTVERITPLGGGEGGAGGQA
jgi:DNA polymerase III alpha subunit